MSDNAGIYSFCDWITVRVPIRHNKPFFGKTSAVLDDPDNGGEILWYKHLHRQVTHESSHSSVVNILSLSRDDVLSNYNDRSACGGLNKLESALFKYGDDIYNRGYKYILLEISGNPTKFYQGHNVWGYFDVELVVQFFVRDILSRCGLSIGSELDERIRANDFYVTRFDLTTNIDMKSATKKHILLDQLSKQATARKGKSNINGSTVEIGRRGRLLRKFYDKAQEIHANCNLLKLPNLSMTTIPDRIASPDVVEEAEKQFARVIIDSDPETTLFEMKKWERYTRERLELTLFMNRALKDIMGYVRFEVSFGIKHLSLKKVFTFYHFLSLFSDFGSTLLSELDQIKLGVMSMSDNEIERMKADLERLVSEKKLSRSVLATFNQWSSGLSVCEPVLSKATFYRHRKALMSLFPSVDISIPCTINRAVKSEPIADVIKANFASPSDDYRKHIFIPPSDVRDNLVRFG